MGSSQSTNFANVTAKAVTDISTNILNETKNNISQNQIFDFSNVGGDINISGNLFNQTGNISSDAIFNSMTTNNAKQKAAQKITQLAKAVTSGINLGNASTASNQLIAGIESAIKVTNNIRNACSANASQNISFKFDKVDGSINFTDNVLTQTADILSKCITTNNTINDTSNTLEQTVSQTAIAETKGFNPADLLFIIALAVLIFMVISSIGGWAVIGKYGGAIALVLGVILFVGSLAMIGYGSYLLYSYYHPTTANSPNGTVLSNGPALATYQFSNGLSTIAACGVSGATTKNIFANSMDALASCSSDATCLGVDWFPPTSNSPTATTIFYSTIQTDPDLLNTCRSSIVNTSDQGTPILRIPNLFETTQTDPAQVQVPSNALIGDKAINKSNGQLFTLIKSGGNLVWTIDTDNTGNLYGLVSSSQGTGTTFIQNITTIDGRGGQVTTPFKDASGNIIQGFVVVYGLNTAIIPIYYQEGTNVSKCCSPANAKDSDSDIVEASISAPAIDLSKTDPNAMPWSGIKALTYEPWKKTAGITLIIVGSVLLTILTIIALVKKFYKKEVDLPQV